MFILQHCLQVVRSVAWNVLRRILKGHSQPFIIRHSALPSRPLVKLPYNWWLETSTSPNENHQSTSVAATTPKFNDSGLNVITSRAESHLAESGIAFDSKSAVLGQQATVYSTSAHRSTSRRLQTVRIASSSHDTAQLRPFHPLPSIIKIKIYQTRQDKRTYQYTESHSMWSPHSSWTKIGLGLLTCSQPHKAYKFQCE